MYPPFTHHDEARSDKRRLLDAVFDCLAHPERRQLLEVFDERAPSPVTLEELAASLTARRDGSPNETGADETPDRLLTSLYHVHLPKLEQVGIVERTAEQDVYELADTPALPDAGLTGLIEVAGEQDQTSVDTLFRALASHRRRIVLDVLGRGFESIQVDTLAREVSAVERAVAASSVSEETLEGVLVSLHHCDLPALSDAGLLAYDSATQTVTNEGHPSLRVPWSHAVLEPESEA